MNTFTSREAAPRMPFAPLAFVLLVILAIPGSILCSQERITISERIGPEIDSAEIAYFNLFPTVRNRISATAWSDGDTSVAFRVVHRVGEEERDTTLTFGRMAVSELAKIVEKYEGLFEGKDSARWLLVRGMIRSYSPIRSGSSVILTDMRGNVFSTYPLFVLDSAVLVWDRRNGYSWDEATAYHIRSIRRSDIYAISRSRMKGMHYLGLGVGAVAGGVVAHSLPDLVSTNRSAGTTSGRIIAGIGATALLSSIVDALMPPGDEIIDGSADGFRDVRQSLIDRAYFREDRPPPEIHGTSIPDYRSSDDGTPLTHMGSVDLNARRTYSPRFSFSASLGTTAVNPAKDDRVGYYYTWYYAFDSVIRLADESWMVSGRYFLSRRFGLSASVVGDLSNNKKPATGMNLTSFQAGASYTLLPATNLSDGASSITIDGGIGIASLRHVNALRSPVSPRDTVYDDLPLTPLVYGSASFSVPVTGGFSVVSSLLVRHLVGSTNVPETVFTDFGRTIAIYRDYTYSSVTTIDLFAGLSYLF